MNAPWLLFPVAAAATAAATVGWYSGFWWGAAAYVGVGAVVLVAMGVIRALWHDMDGSPGPSFTNGPGHNVRDKPVRRSDTRAPHDHRGRLPDGLQVGRQRKNAVVFGIVTGAGGKGRAVPLGHLPQPGQARFQQEVVGSWIH